jgi:hypothetical protein
MRCCLFILHSLLIGRLGLFKINRQAPDGQPVSQYQQQTKVVMLGQTKILLGNFRLGKNREAGLLQVCLHIFPTF